MDDALTAVVLYSFTAQSATGALAQQLRSRVDILKGTHQYPAA